MRIAVAIHDRVWSLPGDQADRLAAALSSDQVISVHTDVERAAAFERSDVVFGYRLTAEEFGAARQLRWIHSPSAGVGALLNRGVQHSDVVVTNSRGVHSATV